MTNLDIHVPPANRDLSPELQEATTGQCLLEQATGFVDTVAQRPKSQDLEMVWVPVQSPDVLETSGP